MDVRSLFCATTLVVLALVACDEEPVAPLDVAAKGPPEVQAAVLSEHAAQFDEDLTDREAGSQQEFAAATYLLAHLQDAGYVVELDFVPVEDLVRSTNVVAAAPGGDPLVLVVAAYDEREQGETIALLLELARVARVRDPAHRIGFVAMGAELAAPRAGGPFLGSRRLAQRLIDDDLKPIVVELDDLGSGEPLTHYGDEAEEFEAATDIEGESADIVDRVWDRAGFPYVVVTGGGAEEAAAAVLTYLDRVAR